MCWKERSKESNLFDINCIDLKIKGWDRRGIRRFNCIVVTVKGNRELSENKDMEIKLKSRCVKVSGKEVERDNDDLLMTVVWISWMIIVVFQVLKK